MQDLSGGARSCHSAWQADARASLRPGGGRATGGDRLGSWPTMTPDVAGVTPVGAA